MRYLTFEEYQKLGGKCTEDTFSSLQFDVEAKMNYLTFNRLNTLIANLQSTPEAVQRLEVKLIDIQSSSNSQTQAVGVTSYSNGIESLGFDSSKDTDSKLLDVTKDLMLQYLYPDYPQLFYRGRRVCCDRKNNIT